MKTTPTIIASGPAERLDNRIPMTLAKPFSRPVIHRLIGRKPISPRAGRFRVTSTVAIEATLGERMNALSERGQIDGPCINGAMTCFLVSARSQQTPASADVLRHLQKELKWYLHNGHGVRVSNALRLKERPQMTQGTSISWYVLSVSDRSPGKGHFRGVAKSGVAGISEKQAGVRLVKLGAGGGSHTPSDIPTHRRRS
jgi:hypothetical protein